MRYNVRYFRLDEFRCKCGCGQVRVASGLVLLLDVVRGILGYPLTVTSGFRCPARNAKVGGAENSRHMIGCAADIVCDKVGLAHLNNFMRPVFHKDGWECKLSWNKGYFHVAVPRDAQIFWDGGDITL